MHDADAKKAQHEDVHSMTISTNNHTAKAYMTFLNYMHGSVTNGTRRVCSVPLFNGPTWEGAKKGF